MRRLLLLASTLLWLVVGVANAATVGPVTSARLNGFVGSGPSGAPTVFASDNFTGANTTNLNGRALVIGQTWTVGAGAWALNNNQAEINGVPMGRAVTATGQPNARLILTVADTGVGGRTSGVVLRSDATAATFLYAYTQNGSGGRIYLAKRDGASSTTLVTYAGVTFTNPATFLVEVNGATVKISYNGVLYINHTLTAADLATFGNLGGYGMLNDNAATVRYDDFRVESL